MASVSHPERSFPTHRASPADRAGLSKDTPSMTSLENGAQVSQMSPNSLADSRVTGLLFASGGTLVGDSDGGCSKQGGERWRIVGVYVQPWLSLREPSV